MKKVTHGVYYIGTTRWVSNCTIDHDVFRHNKCVIPAGTKHVDIAYRCASWTFINKDGKVQRGNLYKVNGKIY